MLSYSFGPKGASLPRVCELQKSNLFVWRLVLNSLTFFKSHTNLRALPVRDVTLTLSLRFVSDYWDISEWHVRSVRAHTLPPASRLHPTNPRAEPKGPQPNQTQRHEPKSLGYFITKTHIINMYDLVSFGFVLWHINHCRIFNAKSC